MHIRLSGQCKLLFWFDFDALSCCALLINRPFRVSCKKHLLSFSQAKANKRQHSHNKAGRQTNSRQMYVSLFHFRGPVPDFTWREKSMWFGALICINLKFCIKFKQKQIQFLWIVLVLHLKTNVKSILSSIQSVLKIDIDKYYIY